MELLIYVANGMYLLSYLMKDIVYLRVLSIVAASCLIAYFFFRAEPIMAVVYWNLFFVAVNTFQVARIVWTRRPMRTFSSLFIFRKQPCLPGRLTCNPNQRTSSHEWKSSEKNGTAQLC